MSFMKLSKSKFWTSVILSFILGWGISFFINTESLDTDTSEHSQQSTAPQDNFKSYEIVSTKGIPPYALETLEYILEYNEAPAGYVGGRRFYNREKLLPKTENGISLKYKEWDVHPKTKGKNRGAERLVTSNTGSAYFTDDHYRSFKRLK